VLQIDPIANVMNRPSASPFLGHFLNVPFANRKHRERCGVKLPTHFIPFRISGTEIVFHHLDKHKLFGDQSVKILHPVWAGYNKAVGPVNDVTIVHHLGPEWEPFAFEPLGLIQNKHLVAKILEAVSPFQNHPNATMD
jgi:hypothetical protein